MASSEDVHQLADHLHQYTIRDMKRIRKKINEWLDDLAALLGLQGRAIAVPVKAKNKKGNKNNNR